MLNIPLKYTAIVNNISDDAVNAIRDLYFGYCHLPSSEVCPVMNNCYINRPIKQIFHNFDKK